MFGLVERGVDQGISQPQRKLFDLPVIHASDVLEHEVGLDAEDKR